MQSTEPQTALREQLRQALAMQRQLEQLLKQGRTHLMELRRQVESAVVERDRMADERDRVTLELSELRGAYEQLSDERASQELSLKATHQHDLEERHAQIQQLQAEHGRQVQELRVRLEEATAERDRLAADLREQHNVHARFVEEAAGQRADLEGRVTMLATESQELERALSGSRGEIEQLRAEAERVRALAHQIVGEPESGGRLEF